MKNFLKQCMTGIDGESYDIGRILWAIVCIGFVVLAAWSVFHGKDTYGTNDYAWTFGGKVNGQQFN